MDLSSPHFSEGGLIPVKYTCDGENVSPALEISGVPEGAQSLALLVEDPDVPKELRPDGLFVHWLMWNIPKETQAVPEHSTPAGATVGQNTAGARSYAGPCPPDREHRYFFKLYALDTVLALSETAGKNAFTAALEGHILAEATLMGRYTRKR